MTRNSDAKQRFVEGLAADNRQFYSTRDGQGLLRHLDLTFEHRWIYLFELLQNAIDAGATRVALTSHHAGTGLTFEHDGTARLREADVEGLSKIFRSTKGASTVGFMGIGFKSVFGRFREVGVTGWGWSFKYTVSTWIGKEFGDEQPDWTGTVLPIWDAGLPRPSEGYTTRFELVEPIAPGIPLESDFERLVSEEDVTVLSILAYAGLKELRLRDAVWKLAVMPEGEGTLRAEASAGAGTHRWQLFVVPHVPSKQAIRRFLEHRRIQPRPDERERVYGAAARERTVLGVVPLSADGTPAPSSRGQVFATLPSDVTLPFGIHIHADWLLNLSRVGLREIEGNAWQTEIADRIAEVVAAYLNWVASRRRSRAFTTAAFAALAGPDEEAKDGLEEHMATSGWLDTLGGQLRRCNFLPAYGTATRSIRFVSTSETLMPPRPFSDLHAEHPEADVPRLLGGTVAAVDVIGARAVRFLRRLGLLSELTPDELAAEWETGLESWWRSLPRERMLKRDLLFRVWGALAWLAAMNWQWRWKSFRCVRTISGSWCAAGDVTYFNEALPSDREPGGRSTRQLIMDSLPSGRRHLPDSWMPALRSRTELSGARRWIEARAEAISLRTLIRESVADLIDTGEVEPAALADLAKWAKHRRRPGLLTHVLVDSPGGAEVCRTTDALIADPYVEGGDRRRRLFPLLGPVSSSYLAQPGAAHEWRSFLEDAGARGGLVIEAQTEAVARGDKSRVAEFLGRLDTEIGDANRDAYTLTEYVIHPSLPQRNAAADVRGALHEWLEQEYGPLRDTGLRQAEWYYYNSHALRGPTESTWVRELAELEWVPSECGVLHRPADILARSDPSRPDCPVAALSEGLLDVLIEEGASFGGAIAEAPVVRRLQAGTQGLSIEQVAQLLADVRGGLRSVRDLAEHGRLVERLAVPTNSGERVPISRLVRRVGAGFRSELGGWVACLDAIPEVVRRELEHPGFLWPIPDSTTAGQALDFLTDVWRRADAGESGLANSVRDFLPAAYDYCLAELRSNPEFEERWHELTEDAMVFAGRGWIAVRDQAAQLYLDDVGDGRLLPSDLQMRLVTGGHLGSTRDQQRSSAEALGIRCLSEDLKLDWSYNGERSRSEWEARLHVVTRLAERIRSGPSDQEMIKDQRSSLGLKVVDGLELTVRFPDSTSVHVEVEARLEEDDLLVTGTPINFASDAARELVRHFGFGQRADLAASLTGIIGALDDRSAFRKAVTKAARMFLAPEVATEFLDRYSGILVPRGDETDVRPRPAEPSPAGHGDTDDAEPAKPEESGEEGIVEKDGGQFDLSRALARTAKLEEELRRTLKGEVVPDEDEGEGNGSSGAGGARSDEPFRLAAMCYERNRDRIPEPGSAMQEGWDIRSEDPATGHVRYIEVKGRSSGWEGDEVVELSRAQVRKAFEELAESDNTASSWWLYVVERTREGTYAVLPTRNPAGAAAKWLLRGAGWKALAVEPAEVTPAEGQADAEG